MRKQYTNPFLPGNQDFLNAMRDYSIWLHLQNEGDPLDDGLQTLYVMASALNSAKPSNVLAKALPLMIQAEMRGTWSKSDLLPFVAALKLVAREYPHLPKSLAHTSLLKALT